MEVSSLQHSKSFTYQETMSSCTKLKNTVFIYEWQIEDFREFLERKYEIPSPIFSIDGNDWKLILFVRHKYPIGPHMVASLVKMSEDNKPIGVKYTISVVSLKHNKLGQSREKIFRDHKDSDEYEIISHLELIKENLLLDNDLIIRCELDILTVKSSDDIKCALPFSEKCPSVKDSHENSNQNLPNMDYTFNKSKISNKFHSLNILYDDANDFSDCAKEQSFQNNEDSINTLLNDFERLYKSKAFSDVTLICDGIFIAAHKVVLAARSNYFKQLCSEIGNSDKINVSGVNIATMDAVLYYLYTGKMCPLTVNFALDIYSASMKFHISEFQTLLFDFLKTNLTVINVTEVLQACEDLKLSDLKSVCLKFVNSNQSEVVRSEKWDLLIKSNPHIAGEVLLTIASFQKRNVL